MSTANLERRYRRLLQWYPWSHRRVYEEEMLAVLVAGARPGQRRPTAGEAANLVVSGLRYRAGAASTALAAPAWRDAAAVVALLAAIVLLSQRVVRLIDPFWVADVPSCLRTVGWVAVVGALLAGARRPAAALAWLTAIGEAVLVARAYDTAPVAAVHLLWPVALGVVAAAALSVPAPRRRAVEVLRLPRLIAFVGGIAAMQTIAALGVRHQWVHLNDGAGTVYIAYGLEHTSELVLLGWLAIAALGAVSAGLAALTLPATVRWRVVVLATPVVTVAAIVRLTLSGWAYSNGHMGHPIYLVPVQWTLLAIGPPAALAIGAALVHWRDQAARLAALGRAADRERHAG